MEKENLPKWEDITRDELGELYSTGLTKQDIADIFSVSLSSVKYKLAKLKLTYRYCVAKYRYLRIMEEEPVPELLDKDNIGLFSKVLTKYIYRDGPIETLHTKYHIPDEEMKEINIYMANKIAGILDVITDGDCKKLLALLSSYPVESYWEEPTPDRKDIDARYEILKRGLQCQK